MVAADFSLEAHAQVSDKLSVAGRALLWAARRRQRRSPFHRGAGLARTATATAYGAWRDESLRRQLLEHFDPGRLADKDVLDFGCGTGGLSLTMARESACRSVVGVDLSADRIKQARAACDDLPAAVRRRIRFVQDANDKTIALPDASVDCICCFDVVEHIPHPVHTAAEWHRILRPGGTVWIWWSPWRGPYGHHCESLIPLPWIHLIFDARTIFRVCAEVYADPAFVPRVWDLDPQTGAKRPNKWRDVDSFYPFLNGLTRPEFERTVLANGLTIRRREIHGFSGSALTRATRALAALPAIGECFVSFYVYELARPA